MFDEQLFLFSDEQIGFVRDEEVPVPDYFHQKIIAHEIFVKTKNHKHKEDGIRIINEKDPKRFKCHLSRKQKMEVEDMYGVPEDFLLKIEGSGMQSQGLGDKLMAHDMLSREEEKALLNAYALVRDDPDLAWLAYRIRNILVRKNMRLIGNAIKQYHLINYVGQGVEKNDLLQYGVEGLIHSIDKYEPSFGNRLSTYAVRWICQFIHRRLDNESDIIRTPVHYHTYNLKTNSAKETLISRTGGEKMPTEDEIIKEAGITREQYERCRQAATCACSVDAPMESDDNEATNFLESMTDISQNTEDEAVGNIEEEFIHKAIRNLPKEEQYVIIYHFGFAKDSTIAGREGMNYSTIGAKMKLPTQRVKKIAENALHHLEESLSELREDRTK